MKEIREYDFAAKKFYTKQDFTSLPLESWDLFANAFDALCNNLGELNVLRAMAHANNWKDSAFIETRLQEEPTVIVVTDAQLQIVHTSKEIYGMTGYRSEEIVGKTPKIFQGEKTCRDTANKIRKAIQEEQMFEATVINYRKDGSTYKCWLQGIPIKNTKGKVVNFIAFEKEVA